MPEHNDPSVSESRVTSTKTHLPFEKPNGNGDSHPDGRLLAEHIRELSVRWPQFYNCIDPAKLSDGNCRMIRELAARMIDFDTTLQGGRGDWYRQAQQNPLIRSVGIKGLFALVSPGQNLSNLTPQHRILDVLGGDGVLARAMPELTSATSLPLIMTSDLSEEMVLAAQAYGLFAIQQPAQKLLLKDDTLDGVILAYGTHHIPVDDRARACQEAYRVLKPGGRAVLHDFEEHSPMAQWFNDIVDRYSQTGHAFAHFTRGGIMEHFQSAKFDHITIACLYDPFILSAGSREEAQLKLADYILNMYGLVKLVEQHGHQEALSVVYELALKYFKYDYRKMGLEDSFGAAHITISKKGESWFIELPRVALVGCGVKGHAVATE